MSYLIENSLVVTQEEYLEDESKFDGFEPHILGDHVILSENDKPFFSIYDIANVCKKKYPNEKLFLIAHRYFDNSKDIKITEFYFFNTLNIFEKSLTAYMKIDENELQSKQIVVQENINIAKTLIGEDNIHIILGDNVKEHEVVEYIHYTKFNGENFQLLDEEILNSNIENDKPINYTYLRPSYIKCTRISEILNSVRILEPRQAKIKKYFISLVSIILMGYFASDILSLLVGTLEEDFKMELQKSQSELTNLKIELENKDKENIDILNTIEDGKVKTIYRPEQLPQNGENNGQ